LWTCDSYFVLVETCEELPISVCGSCAKILNKLYGYGEELYMNLDEI
jgi:hypothetical protein